MRTFFPFALIVVLATGCANFTPPEGYVKDANNTDYDYKAVSAR